MSTVTCVAPRKITDQELRLATPRPAVRVLHVAASLDAGGMERALLRLIEGTSSPTDASINQPTLTHGVCVLSRGDPDLIADCRTRAVTWVLSENESRGSTHRVWRRLGELIDLFAPDVVHARATGAWLDGALALRRRLRLKLVLSFHGLTTLATPGWHRRLANRWATRQADAVLAVSTDAARMIHHQWAVPTDKLAVIHNGVDTRRFHPAEDPAAVTALRGKLGFSPRDLLVLCVANLLPIKSIDVLLHAWRQVLSVHPHASLLLVGEGPGRESLAGLAESLRCEASVRFLGRRDDVPALLRACDLFVLPSRYEACSNACLEAMTSGVPVVACDVGGNREIIEPHRTGWLVAPDHPDRLAEAIVAALLDRPARERIGAAARQAALRHHSLDTWYERYADLYAAVTAGAPLPAGLRPHMEDLSCAE